MRKLTFIGVICMLLTSCKSSSTEDKKSVPGVGIILANRDTTVRPAEDFFRHANGNWITRTAIPPDQGSWSSFDELQEYNTRVALGALQKVMASQEYLEGTDQRKAADFYSIGMDSMLAEGTGSQPLKPVFDRIEAIVNKAGIQDFLILKAQMGADAFFTLSVAPDLKDSKVMSAYLSAGGIGLPERDYYLKTDARSNEIRQRYRQHVINMLILSGWNSVRANKSADRILYIETALAAATPTKEERRDPQKQYNQKAVTELMLLAPSVNWQVYFKSLGVSKDSIIVTAPLFLKECERVFNNFSLEDIQAYFRWSLVREAAPFLNSTFVRESFEFNSHYLLGVDKPAPRWKRVLQTTNNFLGEAIGKLYVAAVFPPEAKKKAAEMVENISLAFADRIKQLDWMTDTTKKMALKKLSMITVKIGYPDKWKNYAGLTIERAPTGSYYGNILNVSKFLTRESINRLGKPVDRTLWQMTPQTANAYYNPQFNEIVFPAGILQPPFYDYRADEAVNYGGIGAAIGHEISHGFDDEGSQYDGNGNLSNWWKADDLKKFRDKGKALAEQFNKYQPLTGVSLQGQFTLGENIGDLGGLAIAYDGLHRFMRENSQNPGLLDGLTPEQRFFISWATIWRDKYKDESLRTQILTNPHAPGMYRANGPLSNMQEFYDAFHVKPGDKMYRGHADRVKIW